MEQRTPEWHEWRLSKIGGSEIATVIGVNPYQKVEDLFKIKTRQITAPDLSGNWFVNRGIALEPKVRELLNEALNADFKDATLEDPDLDYLSCSLDGIDEARNEIAEYKVLSEKNHLTVIANQGPLDYYMPQCQHNLMISRKQKLWFASYCPSSLTPFVYYPVYADAEYQKMLRDKAAIFQEAVTCYKKAMSNLALLAV